MYELLCHKWFGLPYQHRLVLRPLGDGQTPVDVPIPIELKTVRFSCLSDIKTIERGVYYHPESKSFGSLDAFVFVGNACYGLQMTLNRDHAIEGAPLDELLDWLNGAGFEADCFYLTFVVPSHLVNDFKKQSIRTGTASV
ncbi:unnamed protein product [Phytophthora lilii]|uniref:Unnamed protein product n=1 Tax=Phytophthora lilii TaxID=2077276 RepID=A0A9W6TMF2_9STRA|nr:unnamed protein product [Phytophthora lilii]